MKTLGPCNTIRIHWEAQGSGATFFRKMISSLISLFFFFLSQKKIKLKLACWMLLKCHFFLIVCVGQVIKSIMKRVNNNSIWLAYKGLEGSVKFNPALQKEMEERRRSRRSMTTQRQGVVIHLHVYAKDILDEKWDKLCVRWKKKLERLLLEVTSSSKETTKVTLITLKLALEPLFFLPWSSSEWQVGHLLLLWYLLWNHHNSNTENTWLWH